jgi:glycosyltransferase involved in cell wall biosynthesis
MTKKKSLLVIGPASSILIRQRVAMLAKLDSRLYWYSQVSGEGVVAPTFTRLTNARLLGTLMELAQILIVLMWVRPSAVHVFYAKNRWLNLLLALHPRLVVTVMGSDISTKTVLAGTLDFYLVRLLLRRATRITSKSAYMDSTLQRFDVPAEKIQRLTWGIDIKKFRLGIDSGFLRSRLGIAADTLVFFSLRACKPLYQHELVLRALAVFVRRVPNAVLLVSTMGAVESYLSELQRLAKELGIEGQVVFLPTIDNSDMPLFYSLADAVVSVPLSDGMPQSIYEAMACGCFHILGNLQQYQEVVHQGESGLYVELHDETGIAEAFAWVVEHRSHLHGQEARIRSGILPLVDQEIQQQVLHDLYAALT